MQENKSLEEKIRITNRDHRISFIGGITGMASSFAICGIGSYLKNESIMYYGLGLNALTMAGYLGFSVYTKVKLNNIRKEIDNQE